MLEHAGFEVVTASGGAEGLRMLRDDSAIGLVLLDLMMPEMDGWRFRHAQRADARLASVPTLVVTGAALGPGVRDELQAADYLAKPVTPDLLISTVARLCSV